MDSKSKFLWYHPEIALISGIAWDHVNVFPTFENYLSQFEAFILSIRQGGVLLYNEEDPVLKKIVDSTDHPIKKIPYSTPDHVIDQGITYLDTPEGSLPLSIFGRHNLTNLAGAQWIAQLMGVDAADFHEAIPSFSGAAKRLERLATGPTAFLFKDFAHAPSKVKATSLAVKNQYSAHKTLVCLELHTYSSLDPEFLKNYRQTLAAADQAIIFFDPEALKIKNRAPLNPETIQQAFDHPSLIVFVDSNSLDQYLKGQDYTQRVLVMMSSGNFGGLDWEQLQSCIMNF